jgi:hypothetical protein
MRSLPYLQVNITRGTPQSIAIKYQTISAIFSQVKEKRDGERGERVEEGRVRAGERVRVRSERVESREVGE